MSDSFDDEEEGKSLVIKPKKKKKGRNFLRRKKKGNDDDDISTVVSKKMNDAESKLKERTWPFGTRPLTFIEKLVAGAGIFGSLISIGSCAIMILGFATVPFPVLVASSTACVCAILSTPHAICNQAEMATADTFRDVINQVRDGVNKFGDENKKLTSSVDDLEDSVGKLKEVESGLKEIANQQGMQMDELNALIAENKRINKALRKVLKAGALQRIFALLIECDKDGDYKLSGAELNRFAMGLKSIEDNMPIETEELVIKLKEYDNFELTKFLELVQEMFFDDDEEEEEEDHEKNDDDDDDDDSDKEKKDDDDDDGSSVDS